MEEERIRFRERLIGRYNSFPDSLTRWLARIGDKVNQDKDSSITAA